MLFRKLEASLASKEIVRKEDSSIRFSLFADPRDRKESERER